MPDITLVNGILNGASLLVTLIGSAGVMNIMLMTVWERRREVGILRAIGWRRRWILGLFLREALRQE
jgi:putative ABC transport system permease protein